MDTDSDALSSSLEHVDTEDTLLAPMAVVAQSRQQRKHMHILSTVSQQQLSSSSTVLSLHRRRPRDLTLFFLTWLCLSLLCSPAIVSAGDKVPDGVRVKSDLHYYFQEQDLRCTVKGGQCCDEMNMVACQGWFCIDNTCAVVPCGFCQDGDDPEWFCGPVRGADDPRDNGLACKRKAFADQPCHNQTMPCQDGLFCGRNSTCEFLPEEYEKYQEQLEARRMTMIGMLVVLLVMFVAMRRMLKNEEARRRQIWEPVDASAEASILRRLAEDTQRRLAGGWDQLNGSIVAGGSVASQAVGSAITRIRRTAAGARASGTGAGAGAGAGAEDCDDVEMLPSGRGGGGGGRPQTRRELEDDMRAFMLAADDEDDDEDLWGDEDARDEDGLLARNRRRPGSSSGNSSSSSSSNSSGSNSRPGSGGGGSSSNSSRPQQSSSASHTNYSDEPPAYDAVLGGEEQRSMSSTLLGTAPVGSRVSTTTTTSTTGGPMDS